MPTVFEIKRGDTLPNIRATLKLSDGTVQDLTTATAVNFVYAPRDGTTPDTSSPTTRTATIVDAANGIVEYDWIAADTATVGEFLAEFEVEFGTDRLTFPNGKDEYIHVHVVQDVADG